MKEKCIEREVITQKMVRAEIIRMKKRKVEQQTRMKRRMIKEGSGR